MYSSKLNQKILPMLSLTFLPQYYKTCESLLIPCKDDLKSCIKKIKVGVVPKSRCEKMKEALEKCPRSSSTRDCQLKTIPNNSTIENPADVYIKSQKTIKSKANELMSFLEKSKNTILEDMEKRIEAARLQDLEDMRKILCSIDNKMKVLIELDLRCAESNKLDVFKLHDRANTSINACIRSTGFVYDHMKTEMENLVDETCSKIDAIMEIISSCRSSRSPECLAECIKVKGPEAEKLLDEVRSMVKEKLEKFEKAKDSTMKSRKLMSRQISKEYQKETSSLAAKLSEYIKNLEMKSGSKH